MLLDDKNKAAQFNIAELYIKALNNLSKNDKPILIRSDVHDA